MRREPKIKEEKMTTNITKRGDRLYLDSYEGGKRTRIATGLKASALAEKFVKKNYELFLNDKEKAVALFLEFEDKQILKKLRKEELKELKKLQKSKGIDIKASAGVEWVFEQFLNEKQHAKFNTHKQYKNSISLLRSFCIMKKIQSIQLFNRSLCMDFFSFLKNGKRKRSTIIVQMSFLKQFLEFCVANDILLKNPFYMPKIPKSEADLKAEEFKAFSLEEVQRLIENAEPDLRSYLIVAFFTGLREGEILGLVKEDINFKEKSAFIKRTRLSNGDTNSPKTRNSYRKIDLLPIVERELRKICEKNEGGFLFAKAHHWYRNHFKALVIRLGVQKLTLYSTRHTFTSIMLSHNENLAWVSKKMLGHESFNTTLKFYASYKGEMPQCSFIDDLGLEEEKQ